MNKHCTFFYNDQDLPAIYTRGCIVYMLIKYLIIEECAKHKLYLQFQILTCDKIIMDVCPAVHFNPDIRQK